MNNSKQEPKTKKNRKFRFKGAFRKKSKKEEPNPAPKEDGDDHTVYSVNVETSSKMSAASQSTLESTAVPSTPIVGDPIHVILLVMDPKTRRFELLQLEFDSATSKVSEIFVQLAASATEPSLKSQTYEMLVNVKGDELVHSKSLAEYFDSAGIVIAVPTTTVESGAIISRMANPILTNPRVHAMLTSSGLEIPDLPEPIIKVVNAPPKEEESITVISSNTSRPEEKKSKSKKIPTTSLLAMVAILAIAIRLILMVHIHFTSPLGPGDILRAGRSRGFCGLASLLSPSPLALEPCEPMTSRMGDDGVFQVVKKGEVVYELTGEKDCKEGCVAGLFIGQDGKIKINGSSRVKTTLRAKIDLKPWPFAEDVVVPKNFL